MAEAPKTERPPEKLKFVSFTSRARDGDNQSLWVSYADGFDIYDMSYAMDKKIHEPTSFATPHHGVPLIVESFGEVKRILIVPEKRPNQLFAVRKDEWTVEPLSLFSESILRVKMNRIIFVVSISNRIFIFDHRSPSSAIHIIKDTPMDASVMDLSINGGQILLGFPSSALTGTLSLFDASLMNNFGEIKAHKSPLAALKFADNPQMVATASTRGTLIRVFNIDSRQQLYEFRRGVVRCVSISSLAFSPCSRYLCSTSDTQTVHIFCLRDVPGKATRKGEQDDSVGFYEPPPSSHDVQTTNTLFDNIWAAAGALVSSFSSKVMSERSIATMTVDGTPEKITATVSDIDDAVPVVLVATSDGFLYSYTVDEERGETNLFTQHKIGPTTSERPTIEDVDTTAVEAEVLDTYEALDVNVQPPPSDSHRSMRIVCEAPPKSPEPPRPQSVFEMIPGDMSNEMVFEEHPDLEALIDSDGNEKEAE